GQRQTLARYPNEGILKIGKLYDRGSIPRQGDHSNRGAEFGYEYERPARWLEARDIWLHGHFSFGYADDHLRVQQLDTARRSIRLAQPHIYGLYSSLYADTSKWVERVGLSMRGYYAYNLLEEIDQPGEWYLDRESGLLYLYPPPAFATATVEISLRETPFIRLQHTAHIRLENLAFSTARGMGIYLENSHHIDIVACRFSNLGTVAISAGQALEHSAPQYSAEGAPLTDIWSSEQFHPLRIQDCHIARTGTGGIILTGGERRTLSGSQHEISACTFERVDEVNHSYAPAVKLFGVGSTVSHCHFQDLRHMALSFMGNEHRIEYNRFERICTETDDMAAIYTGRDPSARGTVIRHNHFRDILPQDAQSQVGAIFIDDGSGGIDIAHNWFERCGSRGDEEMFGCIALHGGFGNTIHHNLFQDCDIAVGNNYWSAEKWKTFLETPLMRQRLQETVDVSSAVFQEKYPDLRQPFGGERLNQVAHNWLIRSNMVLQGRLELDRNKMLDPDQLDVALKKIGFDRAQIGPR
ncbi:MAG: right-handed parallel beta-helix repeat-containing protein, partial [Saprospiraceae bacterium]|nr:right-handed parallel beta-helix repeat-containing protein [Saprospiraceae bacterium]